MSPQPVAAYLQAIQQELATGHAQEHSYRPALKTLFEQISKLRVVNEPKGSEHGRPDFIFLKGDIPIGYVEAKDIHVSLEKIEKSEQMVRYFGYANLILTNGIEFRFYKNGVRYGEAIIIATKNGSNLTAHDELFKRLEDELTSFLAEPIDSIRSAKHLAQIMGGKARRLRDNINELLDPAFTGTKGVEIETIYTILRKKLIHDLTKEQFADLYAQTLVYGMFVARYHDDSASTFSRTEARDKIPATNHLLQQFFDHIAGINFEKKLSFIVDELCDVFVHADVHALVHGLYLKKEDTHDPIIHFYEDFLREYDPKLRMSRGVFYTPLPVVRYIVRSVDALLKEHFSLSEGLADRSTIEHAVTEQGKTSKKQIARVQILDPAVGTGTFLNEVILHIHEKFKGQEGIWPQYAAEHLVPRLHGFELMMASYTIAHLKLSMTLAETGVIDMKKRLRIFLTNSLEEAPEKDDTLFRDLGLQGALTEEALMAEEVKRDLPIMVVMGNPPYSVSSINKGEWIMDLLKTYKEDLQEKSYNALSDDYVKFIRFAHHLVDKNGQGIVGMITNNSFLDGITHRQMRKSLLETFDHIYIVDLHGNSKRKETAPDGGKDENVFDIMQGVGIILFVKSGKKKKGTLGVVHHTDVYGKREEKYDWLNTLDAQSTKWKTLEAPQPNYFFVPKDFAFDSEYKLGICLEELFLTASSGLQTKRDNLFIDIDQSNLEEKIEYLTTNHAINNEFKNQFKIQDSSSYPLLRKIKEHKYAKSNINYIAYRPFDNRFIYYDKDLLGRSYFSVMKNILDKKNISLIYTKQLSTFDFQHVFASSCLIEMCTISLQTKETTYLSPLYLYPDSATISGEKRTANLNMELLTPALKKLKLEWIKDGTGNGKTICGPEDIFDYIYAILHSPTYRQRYKEFLKIDFPRVPFTSNKEVFWKLVALGREIRLLHLMESPKLSTLITQYPITGSNEVEKISYEDGKVWINTTQYFDKVPKEGWEFPIGGYTPAQKWLKDRKGRMLSSDDILHYQKMIVAMVETGTLMKEIDGVIGENGGFPLQ